jgi:hypothetical protein
MPLTGRYVFEGGGWEWEWMEELSEHFPTLNNYDFIWERYLRKYNEILNDFQEGRCRERVARARFEKMQSQGEFYAYSWEEFKDEVEFPFYEEPLNWAIFCDDQIILYNAIRSSGRFGCDVAAEAMKHAEFVAIADFDIMSHLYVLKSPVTDMCERTKPGPHDIYDVFCNCQSSGDTETYVLPNRVEEELCKLARQSTQ